VTINKDHELNNSKFDIPHHRQDGVQLHSKPGTSHSTHPPCMIHVTIKAVKEHIRKQQVSWHGRRQGCGQTMHHLSFLDFFF